MMCQIVKKAYNLLQNSSVKSHCRSVKSTKTLYLIPHIVITKAETAAVNLPLFNKAKNAHAQLQLFCPNKATENSCQGELERHCCMPCLC